MGYFAADQTTGIPVNVSVDYDDYTPVKVDAQMLKDAQLIATNALREALAERAAVDSVIQASLVLEDEALYAELDSLLDLPEVEVVFDKYMDLETLEAKGFTLTRNGEVLNAQLEWVDAEPVKEGDLAGRAFCVSGFLRCPWDNCCGNRRFSENFLSLYQGGGGVDGSG